MNLEELITSRRTIHQFKPTPIPEPVVQKGLELSRWAPNHRMTLPWKYKVVSTEQRKKMVELALDLKIKKDPNFSLIKQTALSSRLNAPSHWILLAINKDSRPDVFSEDQATLACSVQILCLYFWNLGIGTKWSTGGFSTHEKVFEILDLSPEDTHLMGVLFVGEPDVIPAPPPRS